MLSHGEGIILVTGPTGAGKTTTVYSMLRALDDGTRNLVSIEDPIEVATPGVRQLAVDTRHGITMTSGLRTILRLDPDIVFVSEIRDAEAAETAMRAASSGKYVFSTLHTRDVASTITALRDLHIDHRSLSGNLTGIVSQRLLRRLCRECCRRDTPLASEADLFANFNVVLPQEICRPVGCPRCRNTGYFDRTGIFEVVVPERKILDAIEAGVAEDELRSVIRSQGARSLESDALEKVSQGITSMEEFNGLSSINWGANASR
jgi:type II secretory ATPase GspE/PulE/Tfp pilus assembly ATPase PilB-like protein